MAQFFADPSQISGGIVRIGGSDYNHMKNVLRVRPGEKLSVSDGGSHIYFCELMSYKGDTAELKIQGESAGTELSSRLFLFQGLPKSDKMELIIQKSVELGAYEIVPVEMKRCVVKLDSKGAENRRKRWQAISESAAKQSGRGIIPEIRGLLPFSEALKYAFSVCDPVLVPYEKAGDMERTRELLRSVRPGASAAVFIGPEGGFEESEIREASEAGAEVITLGRRILRTETAGPAVLSALMFLLEE